MATDGNPVTLGTFNRNIIMSIRDKMQPIITSALERADGWVQLIDGLMRGKDKTSLSRFTLDQYNFEELQALVRGDDLAFKIAMLPPRDMLRAGWVVKSESIDKELSSALDSRIEELKILPALLSALFWERVYGGGALLIGADDSQDWQLPLDLSKINKINFIRAVSRVDLKPYMFFSDWKSAQFGNIETWNYTPRNGNNVGTEQKVHSSRIIPFRPFIVSREETQDNDKYWGDSIFVRIYQRLAQLNMGFGGASQYINEMATLVFKVQGYNELMAANRATELSTLLLALRTMRSLTGIAAMDTQDELVQQQINVGGLSDLLTSMQQRVAAATGIPAIPATLLFGKSPDGMNATGEGDIRLYYDQIKAEQTSKLVPALDRIYTLLFSEKSGQTKGNLPDKWTYEFNSLWLQTDKEKAEIRYIMAQADALYNTGQVVSPEEIADSRFKNGFSVDTVLDSDYRKAFTAIQKSEQTAQPAGDVNATTEPK